MADLMSVTTPLLLPDGPRLVVEPVCIEGGCPALPYFVWRPGFQAL